MDPKHYCLYIATPLNETPILRTLQDNRVEFEWYYPKFNTVRQLKKKQRPILKPVFPTYAFVKCVYTPELAHYIEDIPNCYFVPGISEPVTAIDESEMTIFKATIKEYTTSGTVTGKKLVPNVQVEIISGSFAGYTAITKAVIRDTVIVEIVGFGRTVPVTLKQSELSALAP
jgi:transcription antitermination factor NusG